MLIDKGRVVSWVSSRTADPKGLRDLAEQLRKRMMLLDSDQASADPGALGVELDAAMSGRIPG